MHTKIINIGARPTRKGLPEGGSPRLVPYAVEHDGSSYWICAPSVRVARAVASHRAVRLGLGGAPVITTVPMTPMEGDS